ncbi:MAG: DUF115 domain-containing protein [Paludibacteraceae bacterium]|nr:DUF115 domain-containing protein [Paludibacteraceae bacterium]
MKTLLKVICEISIKLFHTIWWLLNVLIKTDRKNHIQYIGKRKLLNILANGPSLASDIEKISLEDGDFSVVNYFYKSPYFKKVKPSIYVIVDPYFFELEDSFQPIIENVVWPMKLVVPYYALKKYKTLNCISNSYIEVIPIHMFAYRGFEIFRNWIYMHGLSMPKGQNVLVPSIFNGINMGYKEIRLYGVDHSWTKTLCVTDKNQVCAKDTHFYDTNEVKLEPYMKGIGKYYKLHELLRDFATMFESYQYLRTYADNMGCKIINKTKGSFIDAFERI